MASSGDAIGTTGRDGSVDATGAAPIGNLCGAAATAVAGAARTGMRRTTDGDAAAIAGDECTAADGRASSGAALGIANSTGSPSLSGSAMRGK